MMSGVVSAAAGVPGPGVAAGKVFRSELNPVDFLVRTAFVYPEKVAVVDGERRYCYRELA
jgi:fatty-acyl-CoA synthase